LARGWSLAGSDADDTAASLPAIGRPRHGHGWENPAPGVDTARWPCLGLVALPGGGPAPTEVWQSRARTGAGPAPSHTLVDCWQTGFAVDRQSPADSTLRPDAPLADNAAAPPGVRRWPPSGAHDGAPPHRVSGARCRQTLRVARRW